MKRTKEKTEIIEEQESWNQMFDSEVTPEMRVGGSRVVCEPSYVPIENLVFGRLAFKGMNQEIEAMMAEKSAVENDIKDKDISDSDMASRLSKNMAKKYSKKRDNAGKPAISKAMTSSAETSNLLAQTSSFLAQVRTESEQAKKSKPNFLKPSDD